MPEPQIKSRVTREQIESILRRTDTVIKEKSSADSIDQLEVTRTEIAKSETKTEERYNALAEKIKDVQSYRILREEYAKKSFYYLCIYTLASFTFVLTSGFEWHGFKLPSEVLCVIVGSTAVSAIGLVRTVVKGLFDSSGNDDENQA